MKTFQLGIAAYLITKKAELTKGPAYEEEKRQEAILPPSTA